MRCLPLLLVLAAARVAFGFDAVLTSSNASTTIEIADLPGHPGAFLVAWSGLRGPAPSGALIYTRDTGSSETRYLPAGGHGPFALVDRGERTLVAGTLVPIIEVVQDDPEHPLRLLVGSGRHLDVAAMTARYRAYEHVAEAREPRRTIEAAIAAQAARVAKACGTKLAPEVAWSSFVRAGRLAQAEQTIALYEALEATCADPDYRTALHGVTALRVAWRTGGGLELARQGGALAATFGDDTFNPRETAATWLADHL